MDDLYKEIILDHYRHPRNVGWIEGATITHHAGNSSCGDVFDMSITLTNGVVSEVRWKGEGCALSTASMSLVSEWMHGKTVGELAALSEKEILELVGLESVTPGREKCLFLPIQLVPQQGN